MDLKMENPTPKTTPTKAKIVRPWEHSPKKKSATSRSSPPFTQQLLELTLQSNPCTVPRTASFSQDSGYLSDIPTTPETSPNNANHRSSNRRYLSQQAIDMMERWYQLNLHHPYPSDQVVQHIAEKGGITITQVKKWMANKRVRCFNTLSFNGSIHPKRLQRLQKKALGRQHPYSLHLSRFSPIGTIPHSNMACTNSPQGHGCVTLEHTPLSHLPIPHILPFPMYKRHIFTPDSPAY